jgi:multidrug efflux system outer membrane protein
MRRIGFLILIAALASCKIGKNYKGTELSIPDAYRFSDIDSIPEEFLVNTDTLVVDSLIDYEWFSLFEDPVLDSLVLMALERNQDLAIAAENIIQARYALGVQRSEMLPEISYQAGASRGNFQQIVLPEEQNIFFGYGSVNWEIDFWGKFRRLNEAAKADIIASEQGYRAAQISLVATVAELYFLLLEYHTRVQISRETIALRDSMLGIIELRFEKGIIPEIDVNQAQIQLAIAEGQLPQWQRLLAQTENQLSLLTGQNPRSIEVGIPLPEQDTSLTIPEGLPLSILTRRPDVLVAEQGLIAQNALVGAAQGNRLPNISLTGLLGVAGDQFDNIGAGGPAWNLGGSLLGPLFYFNRFKRLADIEKSRRDQAQLNFERTVLNAYREVEDILVAIETLKRELIARQDHVTAAINAQTLSQERYNQGVTSYLEYLESQRQAFEAQQNYAATKQELLTSYARLYAALGGGWVIN